MQNNTGPSAMTGKIKVIRGPSAMTGKIKVIQVKL